MPIAHGQGSYYADAETLAELRREDRIVFRYVNAEGARQEEANPNGSVDGIAGIVNPGRNVLGMMPHPERAVEALLGSTDGRGIFESMAAALRGAVA